jgi:hypothetical protein
VEVEAQFLDFLHPVRARRELDALHELLDEERPVEPKPPREELPEELPLARLAARDAENEPWELLQLRPAR